jgi:hypothetical protein
MKTSKVSYSRDVEIMDEISAWQGEINTPLGALLRKKLYTCFNNMLPILGQELSRVINNNNIDDKPAAIKQILEHNNIYYK